MPLALLDVADIRTKTWLSTKIRKSIIIHDYFIMKIARILQLFMDYVTTANCQMHIPISRISIFHGLSLST